MDKFAHFDFYRAKFEELFQAYDDKCIESIGSIIAPDCEAITPTFYRVMLSDRRAFVYLN